MAVEISFRGTDRTVIEALGAKLDRMTLALTAKLTEIHLRLQAKIAGEKLAGQVLKQQSGKLAGSIRAIPTVQEGQELIGAVEGAGGPAWYGVVHERGGTHAYDIVPVSKKALAFMVNGQLIFRKLVHHPPLPRRSFMASTLTEETESIKADLQLTLDEAVQG
jgi:hypothetical protein